MSAHPALRKGWCPGALRPMMAKDGLLVRVRITGGIVSSPLARKLADMADTHGSGALDLSARANLQLRGVKAAALPALLDGLRTCGLLDENAEAEAVRNVLASPLAGWGSGFDIRPVVAKLEHVLSSDKRLHRLPPKFGFLIDDGSEPTLADVSADVRFEWRAGQQTFAVGLGGRRDDASFAGLCEAAEVEKRAAQISHAFLDHPSDVGRSSRMRNLLDRLSSREATCAFGLLPSEAKEDSRVSSHLDIVGRQRLRGVTVIGLASPFGRLNADMLRCAAEIADDTGGRELRLTPWRTILLPGISASAQRPKVDASSEPHESLDLAREAGFIVDPCDARLRVTACVGADGCEQGTTPTVADATSLAPHITSFGASPISLHVSGCEKGCAKPSSSAITLVGRGGRYDLVQNGRANSEPLWRDLDRSQLCAAITALRSTTA